MSTTNNYSNMIKMNVNNLKQHSLLAQLGIQSLTQFEIDINQRFSIPSELIIADSDGQVISNWEYVEQTTEDEIEVCILNIDESDLILILATKNLRKRLLPSKRILLAHKIRECLTSSKVGKELLKAIEGNSTVEKIAKLLFSSYGTLQKDFLIEKYAPEVLEAMDKGECSLEEAVRIATENKDKSEGSISDRGREKTDPKTKNKKTGIAISDFAGADKYRPCEMFEGIKLRMYDGTEIDLSPQAHHLVDAKAELHENGAEFYQILNEETQAFIQLTIKNIKHL